MWRTAPVTEQSPTQFRRLLILSVQPNALATAASEELRVHGRTAPAPPDRASLPAEFAAPAPAERAFLTTALAAPAPAERVSLPTESAVSAPLEESPLTVFAPARTEKAGVMTTLAAPAPPDESSRTEFAPPAPLDRASLPAEFAASAPAERAFLPTEPAASAPADNRFRTAFVNVPPEKSSRTETASPRPRRKNARWRGGLTTPT